MEKYQFDEKVMHIMENSHIPFVIFQTVDKQTVPIVLSAGFCKLYGVSRKEAYDVLSHNMYRDVHPDDTGRLAAAVGRFIAGGGGLNVAYRVKTANRKNYMVVHVQGEYIHKEDGTRLALVWYTNEGYYSLDGDASASTLNRSFNVMLREETMIRRASHDVLTGLPSMAYFFKLADAGRKTLAEEGKQSAILFFDLCGMKSFNRRFGFSGGDDLLRAFGKLLVKYFHDENCCRVSADHFAVYTDAEKLEDKIKKIFQENKELNGGKSLPVRVGIYLDNTEGIDIDRACDRAKIACDKNRNKYISVYEYFSEDMLKALQAQRYFVENLDRALSEKWITVYYQPIVRTANGCVCDEEALARWVDPDKGVIPPAEFIPVLEDTMLIYRLDLYVVEEALAKMKRQAEAGLYVVPISVNLSRADFYACDIVEEICRRVDASGIGRNMLTVEITESIIGSDFEYMKTQVERFSQLGFQVWMDDFGSGYSSLDVLQQIHFDVIKFDMRFMKQFDNTDRSRIILTELMKMAIGLGIETVTEGVETIEQVDFLREIGCTKLQGFFYCCPLPFEKILRRYEKGKQIGFENPQESDYYDAIGRINLYDPAFIAQEGSESLRQYFNTLPTAILELQGDGIKLVRCNRSYREFLQKTMGIDIKDKRIFNVKLEDQPDSFFMGEIKRCAVEGKRSIIKGIVADATVHSFLRRIAVNPVTGAIAVAIVILNIVK
jgi:diguanylate cyclase (GGDEF)-like protein